MKDKFGKEIEFASQIQIEMFEDLAILFFPKILKQDYINCFISDESSLFDFDEEKEIYIKRIKENYGLDVSDIKDLNIVAILKRIRILGR